MTRGCIKLKDPARFSDGFEISNEKLQSAIKKVHYKKSNFLGSHQVKTIFCFIHNPIFL